MDLRHDLIPNPHLHIRTLLNLYLLGQLLTLHILLLPFLLKRIIIIIDVPPYPRYYSLHHKEIHQDHNHKKQHQNTTEKDIEGVVEGVGEGEDVGELLWGVQEVVLERGGGIGLGEGATKGDVEIGAVAEEGEGGEGQGEVEGLGGLGGLGGGGRGGDGGGEEVALG